MLSDDLETVQLTHIAGSLKFSVANTTFYTPGASAALLETAAAAGTATGTSGATGSIGGGGTTDNAGVDGAGASSMDAEGTVTVVQSQELTNGFPVPITLFSGE